MLIDFDSGTPLLEFVVPAFFQYFAFFELNNVCVEIPLIFRIFSGFIGFFEKLKEKFPRLFCNLSFN
jgi:hypothetical protein